MSEEKEFVCEGKLTLSGVVFFITAASEEEAQRKAAAGQWDDYDDAGASAADCVIDALSLKENA